MHSRQNPFSLLVALDHTATATGQLFLDDGESLKTYEDEKYSFLSFEAGEVCLLAEGH